MKLLQALQHPVDFTPMKYATLSPYKRMEAIEIPKEVVEDVDLPVVNQQLKRLASVWRIRLSLTAGP